jgi:hypothetical protein
LHIYVILLDLLHVNCYQPSKKVAKEHEKEAPTPKSSPLPPANKKYVKKTYEGRPDGGPTTRSKTKNGKFNFTK